MTFLEKQTDPTTPMHWFGNMQADYLYTSGRAGDKFFKHLRDNERFLASKCPTCNTVFLPPRLYCEDCFCEIPEDMWTENPATGKIMISTIVSIDTYGKKLDPPIVVGMINIDNTDSTLLGIIHTEKLNESFQGKHVHAVFKPKKKREGTLKDILYYQITE
jgi:uncharacterized OB-fold protein